MTWEQKLQACGALGEIFLYMREPGDWCVNHRGVEKSDDFTITAGCVSGAKTPAEAVEKHWLWLTGPDDGRIVVGALTDHRRAFRWAGFMWEPIKEGKQ